MVLPFIFTTVTVKGIGHLGGLERGLGVIDGGILDETRIVRLFPGAVVKLGDLDAADLELGETLVEQRLRRSHRADAFGGLRAGRLNERQWSVEAESRAGSRGRNHELASGNALHRTFSLLSLTHASPRRT